MLSFYCWWACFVPLWSQVPGHKINTALTQTSHLLTDDYLKERISWVKSTSQAYTNGTGKVKCILKIADKSLESFTDEVYEQQYAFVYLRLKTRRGLQLDELANRTVYPDLWIWTYSGKTGGYEFLKWPMEFGIWSLGILYSYVPVRPFDIEIYNVSGDCTSLEVGIAETDYAISFALKTLTTALVDTYGKDAENRYGTSYYCHKSKIWVEKDIYDLCRNMICSIEALEHVCHSFEYRTRTLTDESLHLRYNVMWWIGPMILAIFLVSVCPLVILDLIIKWIEYFDKYAQTFDGQQNNYVFLDGSAHITVAKVLLCPLLNQKACILRILRGVLPLLSLSFVGVQVLLDYKYLYDIVLRAVDKDIHLGFRSMIAGFSSSYQNYLPVFGGPFIACGLYIFISCILLYMPNDIGVALEDGLANNHNTVVSPLCLNTEIQKKYGSVSFKNKTGYKMVYTALIANVNMCLNKDFWKFLLQLQRKRWNNCKMSPCLFPFFIFICFIEILICALVYGNPLLSFCVIIFRAYRLNVTLYNGRRVCQIPKPVICVIAVLLYLYIAFFFFMFCIIFLDACRFITRISIFTFTGAIVYPTRAYGYLILIFTVIYYFHECLTNFASHYKKLLRLTIDACFSLQNNNSHQYVVQNEFECNGISAKLFMHVIHAHSPIQKRILISFMWFGLIVYVLIMSVQLVIQRDELNDLTGMVNVITELFVASVPKLIQSIRFTEISILDKQQVQEIKAHILEFNSNST